MNPQELPRSPNYPDHARLLEVRLPDGTLQPIKTKEDWAVRRAHILLGMQEVMGPLPSERCPLDLRMLETLEQPGHIRYLIEYTPEPGDRVPAYLLIPNDLQRKAPAMLCLHQTVAIGKGEPVGLGGRPTLRYGLELVQRGYVCLVPDYPSFGDYQYDFAKDAYISGSMKAIWNNIRGVDLLASLPDVDGSRIGCIGHSLGGHNTLFTAAFEPRLKAMVSSCGFTAFCRYYGGDLKGWSSERYMPRILEYGGCSKVPFDFHEVIASLAPRAFFAMAPLRDANFDNQGVREVLGAARRVYSLHGASGELVGRFPDAPHDFPDEERRFAYAFLEERLKPRAKASAP